MAKILCIETSTEVCSVAISENGNVTDLREDLMGQNHSKLLTRFIDELLTSNQLKAVDFDAVAVSEGPGSYTGLRIGVSAAKGICYGAGIPLIAINPLEAMASEVVVYSEKYGIAINSSDFILPMIDARRMEVYTALYDQNLNEISGVEAKVIDNDSFIDIASDARIIVFGNGSAKCKQVLTDDRFIFVDGVVASSKNMAVMASHKFEKGCFVDVAYFEPFYLKDFIATTPKNSVLKNL
jgi:tRNA threonylcarbamoyladenosine biosynthesis protein TsaB